MTSIRVSLYHDGSVPQGDVRLIDAWHSDCDDKLSVGMQNPTHETLEPMPEERFGFHQPAAVFMLLWWFRRKGWIGHTTPPGERQP